MKIEEYDNLKKGDFVVGPDATQSARNFIWQVIEKSEYGLSLSLDSTHESMPWLYFGMQQHPHKAFVLEYFSISKSELQMLKEELEALKKEHEHLKATIQGLWVIDRDPKEVSKFWIEKNAYQLK
jgi:hypothetical protein